MDGIRQRVVGAGLALLIAGLLLAPSRPACGGDASSDFGSPPRIEAQVAPRTEPAPAAAVAEPTTPAAVVPATLFAPAPPPLPPAPAAGSQARTAAAPRLAALRSPPPPPPPPLAPAGVRASFAETAPAPPAPASTALARPAPASPAPTAAPRLRRARRWDLTLEGAWSIFNDPGGIMGEALPPGMVPFSWSQNNYTGAFGARVTVGYRFAARDRVEVRGTWRGSWEESTRQTAQFGFRATPSGALAFSPAGASATLTNETDIYGGEVNWWHTADCSDCWRIHTGLGLRYLRVDDLASATNWAGVGAPANLISEADNGLLAAQLLGRLDLLLQPRFELSVTAKVILGAMNRDLRESDTAIVTGGVTQDASREDTEFGWGLEGELGALYRISPNIALTASYSILFLEEVARAEAALDFTQAATGSLQLLSSVESAVVHTFFFGVRIDM